MSRIVLTLMAAVFGLVLGPITALAAGEWLVDPKTGCRIWNGYPEPGENVSWDGPCENGYAQGFGRLTWFKDDKANGTYEGERKDGKANGYGINTWVNGDRYEGQWRDDKPHGEGTYTWANGAGYKGGWIDGRKEGTAIHIWPSGDRFEGTYRNDRPFAGTYIKADGSRWIAEISENSVGPGARYFTEEERVAIRTVGSKVCRPSSMMFGMFDTTIVGFVEAVNGDRIQIRVAKTGYPFQTHEQITLGQNTILWDDAANWELCRVQP